MSNTSTKHAKVIGKSVSAFLGSEFAILERLGFLFCLDEPDKLGLGLLLDEEEADLLSEG